MDRIHALRMSPQRDASPPSPSWEVIEKRWLTVNPRVEPPTESVGDSIMDFPSSRTVRNTFLLPISQPVSSAL